MESKQAATTTTLLAFPFTNGIAYYERKNA